VEDSNDNAPIFYNNNITLTLLEATNISYSVNVSAFDLDIGVNSLLNYTIESDTGTALIVFIM